MNTYKRHIQDRFKMRFWNVRLKEFIPIEGVGIHDNKIECSICRVDDEIVPQQNTGLKDKNGREIYEGDIIIIKDKPISSRPSPVTKIVKWSNLYAGFCIGGGLVESIEIIGNIFENPELLK
jgi:uncharacterized phage protein (TIGR01671 family)